MCGITGFYGPGRFTELQDALQEATDSLSHRGPDDWGIFWDPDAGVGLGHRRLSIIDLSRKGRQPMRAAGGRVAICYNGEVYNFREIRKELEKKGHAFDSDTDTEVILQAFLAWGLDCLSRFTGMFSLAIWDGRADKLFLARDRMGIKPLYYYLGPNRLIFASELKGLMAHPVFPRNVDPNSLARFLHFQYVPGPQTIFQDTFKLLPGHYAVFDGRELVTRPYWQVPDFAPDPGLTETRAADELERLVFQSVSDRLVADVPLGALLSGGVDSSLIAAAMAKTASGKVRTFSIGFDQKGFDEAPYARKIAEHLGTDHTELYAEPGLALEVVPDLAQIYDEPFADSSAMPTYLVSRLAREHVTVALSGDGGDEQFAGYVRYWMTQSMAQSVLALPRLLRRALSSGLGAVPVSALEKLYSPVMPRLPQRFQVQNFPDKWKKLVATLSARELSELYRMTVCIFTREEVKNLLNREVQAGIFDRVFNQSDQWPPMVRAMRCDQQTYLPDAMLTKVDRASMAVSLEVRVPLLDHRIVEFTSCLPVEFNFQDGVGKALLKKVLARHVPRQLFERPKMGFGVPLADWLRGELKPLVLDTLSAQSLAAEGIWNVEAIQKLKAEHLSGAKNHQYRLWTLIMWRMWREHWLRG